MNAHIKEVEMNYRFVRADKDDVWENEHRPHASATIFKTWQPVTLSNRSRLEHRMLDNTNFNFLPLARGVEVEITKNFFLDLYYLRRDDGGRGTEPKTNAVGLGANLYF
jgi:hypothetical protein